MDKTKQIMYNTKIRKQDSNNYDTTMTKYFSGNKLFVYKYILNNAGIHLRKICKELGLAMGDTQYHLNMLEKEGLIKSRRIGNHRHYYPVAIQGEQNELILALLRQETIRDILIHLMKYPGSNQQDLASFKNVSAPTIKWHMNRLIDLELVILTRNGKKVNYFIKDIGNLISSMKNYMPIIENN